ncbi:MAG TPA: hypothetical protein VFS31_07875, partial [Chitinophagaceae bacterium]|nr:hypothetical protein [Chitinophagaceae bacterium]
MKKYLLALFTGSLLILFAASCNSSTTQNDVTDTTAITPETTVPPSPSDQARPDTNPAPAVDSRMDTSKTPDNTVPPEKKM